MAKLTKNYTLELTALEVAAIEQLIGGCTDSMFENAGVSESNRVLLLSMWTVLEKEKGKL